RARRGRRGARRAAPQSRRDRSRAARRGDGMTPPRHAWAIAIGRALNALLFLFTSIYCLLTFSPFAYEQFIQPHVVAWLSNFVLLFAAFYWLGLCVTFLTLVPHLKTSSHRAVAWSYLIVAGAAGLAITWMPILPGGNQPSRSLTIALLALVPIV